MGFNPSAAASNATANAAPAATGNGNFVKAKGFINIYLPTQEGGRVKVGSIALRDDDRTQKAVLDYLATAQDEDSREGLLGNLVNKMQFEYNLAEGKAFTLAL